MRPPRTRLRTVYSLLTDVIRELDDVVKRLGIVAEMLLEARNVDAGLTGMDGVSDATEEEVAEQEAQRDEGENQSAV